MMMREDGGGGGNLALAVLGGEDHCEEGTEGCRRLGPYRVISTPLPLPTSACNYLNDSFVILYLLRYFWT